MTRSDEVWEQRVLCSDGNCIGVVGSDGLCKACGQPYTGDLPLPRADADETDDVALPAEAEPETPEETVDGGHAAAAAEDADELDEADEVDDDWAARTLCIDESCIGVVGPDGRCKECGKPYPGKEDDHDRDTDR